MKKQNSLAANTQTRQISKHFWNIISCTLSQCFSNYKLHACYRDADRQKHKQTLSRICARRPKIIGPSKIEDFMSVSMIDYREFTNLHMFFPNIGSISGLIARSSQWSKTAHNPPVLYEGKLSRMFKTIANFQICVVVFEGNISYISENDGILEYMYLGIWI